MALQSFMAFALVMILFSTIVSGITEFVLRIVKMRARVLHNAMVALAQEIIFPQVADQIDQTDETKSSFVDQLLVNPSATQSGTKSGFWRILDFLSGQINQESIDELSTPAFIQRMAKTDVGKAIAANDEPTFELLVKDFANSFERYTAASSEVFRKRAHYISFAVAIAFALIMNVHAGRLLEQLQKNPQLVQSLLAKADQITAKVGSDDPVEEPQELAETLKAVEKQLQEVRSFSDLPIGHEYFPYGEKDAPLTGDGVVANLGARSAWLVNAVLAGILIGLGGPFWFRVYSNISQFVQVLHTFGPRSGELIDDTRPSAGKPGKAEGQETLIELFKISAHVENKTLTARVNDTPEPAG